MPDFDVAEAQIVALFMESVAYGAYLVTLGFCIRSLFWTVDGTRKTPRWSLVIVTALMALFSTFDVAFGLRHNLDAFIFYTGPGGPDGEFHNISYWVNVMKTVDLQLQTIIGDGMLIYRCYVVYSRKWWIVTFPFLLWLGNVATSIGLIYFTATLSDVLLSASETHSFIISFLVLTLVLNILTTGLIVYRIWKYDHNNSNVLRSVRSGASKLRMVNRIVIESGLMYTIMVLITFGTALANSNAIYGVSDVLVIVTGISFNLIIIRVDRGTAMGDHIVTEGSIVHNHNSIPLKFSHPRGQMSRDMGRPQPTLEISVTQERIDDTIRAAKPTGSIDYSDSASQKTWNQEPV